jgi:hypothetical protein
VTEDRYRLLLDDWLDGSLHEPEHREVEAHVKSCEHCRAAVADLTAIRDAASSLERLDPPPRVWERVRDSVRGPSAETAFRKPSRVSEDASLLSVSPGQWAIAATVLASLGALVLAYTLGLLPRPAPSEGSPEWISAELQLAEDHYQNAIRGLETIVAEGQTSLDPQVAAVLRQNLTVIEDAIVESRAAARDEPANPAAGESLLAALRQKVSLLQNTVLLINEIRKGEGEGAVNILNDMRDSANENNPG